MGVIRGVAHHGRRVVGRVSPTVAVLNNRYDKHKAKKEQKRQRKEQQEREKYRRRR